MTAALLIRPRAARGAGSLCALAITLWSGGAAAVCGDGVVDEGEPCDDGNPNNSDGCLVGCIAPSCGDGYLYSVTEECDAGQNNSDSPDRCHTNCVAPRCGDAFIDSDEACDDGNRASWDGCSAECEVEAVDGGGGGGGAGGGGDGGEAPSGGCAAAPGAAAAVLGALLLRRPRRRRNS